MRVLLTCSIVATPRFVFFAELFNFALKIIDYLAPPIVFFLSSDRCLMTGNDTGNCSHFKIYESTSGHSKTNSKALVFLLILLKGADEEKT